MESWRRLSTERLNQGQDLSKDDGVQIHVFLSPYDVPEKVRGYYDEDAKLFRIEFKYLTDEKTEISKEKEQISLVIGRNSGRLMGINVDVVSLRAKSIELKIMVPQLIDKAIADLEEEVGTHNRRRGNYDLTREVIKEHKDEIFSELVPA